MAQLTVVQLQFGVSSRKGKDVMNVCYMDIQSLHLKTHIKWWAIQKCYRNMISKTNLLDPSHLCKANSSYLMQKQILT